MHEIDFLPAEYRQGHAERRWQGRRILLAAGLAAMMLAAFVYQHHRSGQLKAQLERSQPACAQAARELGDLNQLQSRLEVARAGAELFTYLRHPWPRTRIIAALLDALPEEIRFEQFQIEWQPATGGTRSDLRSPSITEAEANRRATLPPAARDLKRLRGQLDSTRTVVTLAGTTTSSDALHRYLLKLGRESLFSQTQLLSIEADDADRQRSRFGVMLVVRPGYGKPRGPAGPDENVKAPAGRNHASTPARRVG